jgi:radical SAM superfamily enzyme YgiQ (UPF0313 family)
LNYPTFIFSRGCPYNCSYCCNNALQRIYKDKGKQIRFRSVDKAIEEIRTFLRAYKVNHIGFDDDSFTKKRGWLREFCDKYAASKEFPPFACNTRPELFDEETASLLEKAGCYRVNIGIESGSEDLRKRVLNRNMTDKDIIRSFELAKKHRFLTHSFNIIGFPKETKRDFDKTIELNRKVQPDYLQLSMFYPYPGTPLGDMARENGYVSDKDIYSYFQDTIMELPGFSRRQILWTSIFFRFNVYKFSKPQKAIACLVSDVLKFLEIRIGFINKITSFIRFLKKRLKR